MASAHGLTLYQEIMLLALHDEKGTASFGSMHAYGLGGAILAELIFSKHVEIVDEGRHGLVVARNPKSIGDAILDDCLLRVRNAKRRASPATWVSRFAGTRGLGQRVARSLVERGVLRETEGRVLFVFTRRTYPTLDPAPERALVERLRTAIFTEAETDDRTSVLVALAKPAGLLDPVFGRKELKARKARIEHIARGGAAGRATRHAIEAVQAAMMAATIAATSASG